MPPEDLESVAGQTYDVVEAEVAGGCHGSIAVGICSVDCPSSIPEQRARRIDANAEVGNHEGDRLMVGDWPTEGRSLHCVLRRVFKRRTRSSD